MSGKEHIESWSTGAPQKRRRVSRGPITEPFLWRWSDAELDSLERAADAQLLRTRDVWSRTYEDAERERLTRRINGLADLIEKCRHIRRERSQEPAEPPKPPDSPA